ncbi:hypothetical protein EIN_371300 [Entamoeba invadens IP1]|uniref:VPS9 domain-containing protein n=1 Tax=Entamoeba invadens IP1 TaxID=370355 RepID=A0A0A1UC60_ENTIV|nr:hypothetical protein EIN_371300 [Entamoeba invadens IP1]ELP92718.1 hypothetical protein EIN_371300 [Entamoeba invadens IP1]|eukprot:XP_004259489.1 hypothetical protein EIN_371300 [Entamoeba invadens IP1]
MDSPKSRHHPSHSDTSLILSPDTFPSQLLITNQSKEYLEYPSLTIVTASNPVKGHKEDFKPIPPKPTKTPPSPRKVIKQHTKPISKRIIETNELAKTPQNTLPHVILEIPTRSKSNIGEKPNYQAPKPQRKFLVVDSQTKKIRRRIQSRSFMFVDGVPLNVKPPLPLSEAFVTQCKHTNYSEKPVNERNIPTVTIKAIPPAEILNDGIVNTDAKLLPDSTSVFPTAENKTQKVPKMKGERNFKNNSLAITTHPMFRYLKKNHQILSDALKLNALFLLPPASSISDLKLTPGFIYTHFILLDTETLKFTTLTQIPGSINDGKVKVYMSDVKDFVGTDFEDFRDVLEFVQEIATSSAGIYSTRITGIDTYNGQEGKLLYVMNIENPLYQHGCSWAWKLMDGYAPLMFNENTIELSLDLTFETIRSGIPGIEEQEKLYQKSPTESVCVLFAPPLDDERKKELLNVVEKQKGVYKRVYEIREIKEEIDSFVASFPEMVNGMKLEERKSVIDKYVKEVVGTLRQRKAIINEDRTCAIVLNRAISTRVFPYIWPPSIEVMEGKQMKETEEDARISSQIFDHQFMSPELLDVEFDENKATIPLSYAINCLKQIDSVRTAQDKLAYIYVSLKVLEMTIVYVTGNVSGDTFVPILIYALLKANLPHLASTISFVSTFAETTHGAHSCYFCNFVAAASFIKELTEKSFHFEEDGLYTQFVQQSKDTINFTVKRLCPPINPSTLFTLFDFNRPDDSFVTLCKMLKASADNFPREEIPTLLGLIASLYKENCKLKKQAEEVKKLMEKQ